MKKFWYISRDPTTVGYHDPKQAYFSLEEAKAQAEVLCKKHGHDFYVMESVQMVKQSKPPIEWVDVTIQGFSQYKAKRYRDFYGRFVTSDHPQATPYDY